MILAAKSGHMRHDTALSPKPQRKTELAVERFAFRGGDFVSKPAIPATFFEILIQSKSIVSFRHTVSARFASEVHSQHEEYRHFLQARVVQFGKPG
jgi:hypothetical protein